MEWRTASLSCSRDMGFTRRRAAALPVGGRRGHLVGGHQQGPGLSVALNISPLPLQAKMGTAQSRGLSKPRPFLGSGGNR